MFVGVPKEREIIYLVLFWWERVSESLSILSFDGYKILSLPCMATVGVDPLLM